MGGQNAGTASAEPGSSCLTEADAAHEQLLADVQRLRPELRGIAVRYGLDMLEFATRIAGANAALDWLQTYTITHSRVGPQVMILMDAQSHFANSIMELRGWSWETLGSCMLDIGRAAQLARPAGNA